MVRKVRFENLVRGDRESIAVDFMYERYQIETQVTASKVPTSPA